MPFLFEPILREIVECFQDNEVKCRVRLMVENECQTEGWIKLELVRMFQTLLGGRENLDSWASEVRNEDGKQLDFVLLRQGKALGVEVKTCLLGPQNRRTLVQTDQGCAIEVAPPNNNVLRLSSYTGKGYAADDIQKLITSQLLNERIFLAFAYGKNEYLRSDLVQRFSAKLNDLAGDTWAAVRVGVNSRAHLGEDRSLETLAYSIEKIGL